MSTYQFIAGRRYLCTAELSVPAPLVVNGKEYPLGKGVSKFVFDGVQGLDYAYANPASSLVSISFDQVQIIDTVEQYLCGDPTPVVSVDGLGTMNISPIDIVNAGIETMPGLDQGSYWNPHVSYPSGKIVSYAAPGGDPWYYVAHAPTLGEPPVVSGTVSAAKWTRLAGLRPVFNLGAPMTGVDYAISRADYLNIEGQRRSGFTEYEVVGRVVSLNTAMLTFSMPGGALCEWLFGSSTSFDVSPNSSTDYRLPTFSGVAGSTAMRSIPASTVSAPAFRGMNDPVDWIITASSVGRPWLNGPGVKFPHPRSWPANYVNSADHPHAPASVNASFRLTDGSTSTIPVFDVFNPAWNYANRYNSNIVLFQDYSSTTMDFIAPEVAMLGSHDDSWAIPGSTVEIGTVPPRYATVDSVMSSTHYGKVVTFVDPVVIMHPDGSAIEVLSSEVAPDHMSVLKDRCAFVDGAFYSVTFIFSGNATVQYGWIAKFVTSAWTFSDVLDNHLDLYGAGTSYVKVIFERTETVSCPMNRQVSGTHSISLDLADASVTSSPSLSDWVSAGILKYHAPSGTYAYSPVINPADMVFDMAGTDLKVTVGGKDYYVSAPSMSKVQVRDYLMANPFVMPNAADTVDQNYVTLCRNVTAVNSAPATYVYLPTTGVRDGYSVNLTFNLINSISQSTKIYPCVYVLTESGSTTVADPVSVLPYDSEISVGGKVLPHKATMMFPGAAGYPTKAELEVGKWKIASVVYPNDIGSAIDTSAVFAAGGARVVDIELVYSAQSAKYEVLSYACRPAYGISATPMFTSYNPPKDEVDYVSALGEWKSKSYGQMRSVEFASGGAGYPNKRSVYQYSPLLPMDVQYNLPRHDMLSVNWLGGCSI